MRRKGDGGVKSRESGHGGLSFRQSLIYLSLVYLRGCRRKTQPVFRTSDLNTFDLERSAVQSAPCRDSLRAAGETLCGLLESGPPRHVPGRGDPLKLGVLKLGVSTVMLPDLIP